MKICGFCGHRDCDDELREQIRATIKDIIENDGITVFYSGGMGDFDRLCEHAVREIQRSNKDIKLYLIKPSFTQKLNTEKEYYSNFYDGIIIPDFDNVHYKRIITKRNEWIVNHSDIILCYVIRRNGGAYKTLQHALKMNKSIRKLE